MQTPIDYRNEATLRATFSWITAQGAGRKFGSACISEYQRHQCKALDIIEECARRATGQESSKVRFREGVLQARKLNPLCDTRARWVDCTLPGNPRRPDLDLRDGSGRLATANAIYDAAWALD